MGTRQQASVQRADVELADDVHVFDDAEGTAIIVPDADGYTEIVLSEQEAHRLAHHILAEIGP